MGIGTVEPRLLVTGDGSVVLLGGRPGLRLWIDPTGAGTGWRELDVAAHHNACRPDEPILRDDAANSRRTIGYLAGAVVDDRHLVVVYDRTPQSSWPARPAASDDPRETFSCWIARIGIGR
jgi:hypothetical protein